MAVTSTIKHDQRILETVLASGASWFRNLARCEDKATADLLVFLCEAKGLLYEREQEPPRRVKPSRKLLWFMAQGINRKRQIGEGGYLLECLGK